MGRRKRIRSNFYMIDGYQHVRYTEKEKEEILREYGNSEMTYEISDYHYVLRSLPDGRLYSGWGFQYPTSITIDDLPDDYILLNNYKKHGYIRTSGVKDLMYKPSVSHNHHFKDDFIYISYTKEFADRSENENDNWWDLAFDECDEYIFGNDIVNFILAVERNSPDVDVSEIKRMMVEQYNACCDEVYDGKNHIETLEELI